MLKYKKNYHELGDDYLDNLHKDKIARYHKKVLEKLGYSVTEKEAA